MASTTSEETRAMPLSGFPSVMTPVEPYGPVAPSTLTPPLRLGPGRFDNGVVVEEASTNLIPNATSEPTSAGSGSNVTPVVDNTVAWIGGKSFKYTVTATGVQPQAWTWGGVAVAPNTTYTATVYARTSVARNLRISIDQYTEVGGAFVSSQLSAYKAINANQWSRLSFTFTTPANVEAINFNVQGDTAWVAGDVFWLDAGQVEQKAYATSFIAGDLGTGYSWDVAGNTLTNPSFETDTTGWTGLGENLLDAQTSSFESASPPLTGAWGGWTNCSVARSTTSALSGTASLAITATAAGTMAFGGAFTPGFGDGNTALMLVVSMLAGSTPRQFQLGAYFKDAGGNVLNGGNPINGQIFSDNPNNWTQGRLNVVPPTGAVSFQIFVNVIGAAAGEVHYIDQAGAYPQPLYSGGGVNMVDNGGFETDTSGWARNGSVGSIAKDNTRAHTLGFSLLYTAAAGGTGDNGASTSTYLVAGQTYTFSAWVYQTSLVGAGGMRLSLLGAATNSVVVAGAASTVLNTWVRLTLTYTAATSGSVACIVGSSGATNAGAQVWIDSVKCENGPVATVYTPRRYSNMATAPQTPSVRWYGSSGGAGTTTTPSTGGPFGGQYTHKTWTTAPSNSDDTGFGVDCTPQPPGTVVTGSIYLRCSKVQNISAFSLYSDGSNEVRTLVATLVANTWTRVSYTTVVPAGKILVAIILGPYGFGAANWAVGDTLDGANGQVELGMQPNPYVDGGVGAGVSWDVAGNFVSNPSFETDTSGWTGVGENMLPAADSDFESGIGTWFASVNVTVAQTAVQAASGTKSLQATAFASGDMQFGGGSGTLVGGASYSPVVPGALHTFVVSTRAATTPRGVTLILRFVDSAGTTLVDTIPPPGGNSVVGWTQQRVTALAPANAAGARLYVKILGCAAGEVHYADKLGLFTAPVLAGSGSNLINNGGFELGSDGWFSAGSATPAWTTARSHTLVGALQVTLATQGGANATGAGCQVSVLPNTTYTFTAWTYNPTGGVASVQTSVQSAGMTTSTTAPIATKDVWVRHTNTFTTGPTTTQVTVYILNGAAATAGQVFYADSIKLESGGVATPYVPRRYYNLIANPSAEVDTSNTTAYWVPTITRDTTEHAVGVASVKVVTSAGAVNREGVIFNSRCDVVPGTVLTASAYVKAPAGQTMTLKLRGVLPATVDTVGNTDFTATGGWDRVSVTGTTVAGTTEYGLSVHPTFVTSNLTFWVDGAQLEIGAQMNPYVDGSLGVGYSWDSSANLITSDADAELAGTAGWSIGNGTTIAKSTADKFQGTQSVLATVPAFGPSGVGTGRAVILAPSTVYTLSVYAKNVSMPGNGLKVSVQGVGVTSTVQGPDSTAAAWTRLAVTFVSSATGGAVTFYVLNSSTTLGGEQFYVDAFQVEQGPYATAFGSAGTAHASSSTVDVPWGLTGQCLIQRSTGVSGTPNGTAICEIPSQVNPNLWAQGASYKVTLAPNTTYTASAYLNSLTNTRLLVEGPALAAPVQSPSSAAAWGRMTVTFTTNSIGGTAYLRAVSNPNASGWTRVDAVQLEQRMYAAPFGATGAANASTSSSEVPWGLASQHGLIRVAGGASGVSGGSWSAQITSASNPQLNPNLWGVGASYKATLAANTTYTFSAYTNSLAGCTLMADGPGVTPQAVSPAFGSDGGAWFRKTLTFTTNAAGGVVYLRVFCGPTAAAFNLDAVQLEQRGYVTPYGTTGGANTSTATRQAGRLLFPVTAPMWPMTVCGWIRVTDGLLAAHGGTVARLSTNGARSPSLTVQGTRMSWSSNVDAAAQINGSGLVQTGDLVFIAGTIDATGLVYGLSYAKNGGPLQTQASSAAAAQPGALQTVEIGSSGNNFAVANGPVEQVLVYNTVLSAAELQSMAMAPAQDFADDPRILFAAIVPTLRDKFQAWALTGTGKFRTRADKSVYVRVDEVSQVDPAVSPAIPVGATHMAQVTAASGGLSTANVGDTVTLQSLGGTTFKVLSIDHEQGSDLVYLQSAA